MLCALFAVMMAAVPPARSWECVPSVVKSDGSEPFRLFVSVEADVRSVTLEASVFLQATGPCALRDDGQDGDEVAGDRVYTSPAFTPALPAAYAPLLDRFWRDPDSPAGIGYLDVGTVTITRADGSVSKFQPDLGLILPDRASVPRVNHSPEVQATSHLLNIRHATAAQQRHPPDPEIQSWHGCVPGRVRRGPRVVRADGHRAVGRRQPGGGQRGEPSDPGI